MNDLDLKALWQSDTAVQTVAFDLDEIKERAHAFERKIRRRNILEWLACAAVIALFGRDALTGAHTLEVLGNWMTVAAAIGIAAYLFLKGRVSQEVDPALDGQKFLKAHADALRAQARLCATTPLWYLGPLAVGLTLLMTARFPAEGSMVPWALTLAFVGLTFGGIWVFNLRAARRLRDQAAALDAEMDSAGHQE